MWGKMLSFIWLATRWIPMRIPHHLLTSQATVVLVSLIQRTGEEKGATLIKHLLYAKLYTEELHVFSCLILKQICLAW